MRRIYIDFETRSRVDLKKAGPWRYAEDPSTEIMCLSYGENEGPIQCLIPPFTGLAGWIGKDINDSVMVAHNAIFEYAVWSQILAPKYGIPPILNPSLWYDTAAAAAACALPTSLEKLCAVLKSPFEKDMEGNRVMKRLCSPDGKTEEFLRERDEGAGQIYQKLYHYCNRDVAATRWLDQNIPLLPKQEQENWALDLLMARRGVPVDRDLAAKGQELASTIANGLNRKMSDLTLGVVSKTTQRDRIIMYVESVCPDLAPIETLDANALETKYLPMREEDGVITAHAKEVLQVRLDASKSSNAKFSALLAAMSNRGDRIRGVQQYHVARTGREGGRILQPQNLPQGLKLEERDKVIEEIKDGTFPLLYGDGGVALRKLSGVIRGLICAPPGNILLCADYGAIESRTIFWLAGEEEALDTYRKGGNLYEKMAETIFHKEVKKGRDSREYALGKAAILGCGFGMGWRHFKDTVLERSGIELMEEESRRVVGVYRSKFSRVKNLWYQVENAAKRAIRNPGKRFEVEYTKGKIAYQMDETGRWLRCLLPSGRALWYFNPSVETYNHPEYGEKEEIRFWGVSSKTHQWCKLKTYGGSLTENFVQAVARDLLFCALVNCHRVGFKVILTVHDEIVCEVRDYGNKESNLKQYRKLVECMCTTPEWAEGLPVTAEGWYGGRYRK